MSNLYTADIEANGLLDTVTKFHCMVLQNLSTRQWYVFTRGQERELEKFLAKGMTLIMHNGVGYDKPALNKLGIKCDNKIIDTLMISWYLEPERTKHGLESYGEQFGVPKPPVYDWHNEPLDVYVNRCTEDVKIQTKLWEHQTSYLNKIYGVGNPNIKKLLDYMELRANILRLKAKTRWKLDVQGAKKLLDHLESESLIKTEELAAVMPKQPVFKVKNRPKVYYKKNGDLSSHAVQWEEFCEIGGYDKDTPNIKYIDSYKPPQPHYVPEVKEWLFSLGWVPETFEFKRNKDTGETRQIPQVTIKNTGGQICPSIERLAEKVPELQALVGYSLINHRKGFVKAMLDCVSADGYLIAEVQGFTNTIRSKHSRPLANIPSIRAKYGKEIRGLLTCNDDEVLIGSDMSSLEDRIKHHFQFPLDPEYVKTQMAPDFDPHLLIAMAAGLLTEEQVRQHKAKEANFGAERQIGKGGNYSCQYGAGPPTVARSCGVSEAIGRKVHKAYWDVNWSIKKIAASTTVKKVDGKMWQLNPINGLWYYLKVEKDRFSTLAQGSGAYSFDIWIKHMIILCQTKWKRDLPLCGDFHDEVILRCKNNDKAKAAMHAMMREAIGLANEELKLNRELDIEIQFGNAYSDIH